ncbi:uncharacterized protein [Rutidosis leptorrhynchoides]|uniref:uncharacterized protein isoform X2 n=2 Tax=Rutidosis leptorrhynchoides TaxID=125765 RepID=UPI003A99C43C
MVAPSSGSNSLKEYLKRYENPVEDEKKKKKKKKKKKINTKPVMNGVLVVDEDPVWQKPVEIPQEDDDSEDEEQPQIDEDIEVKRMKRLEQLKTSRPFGAISEDGSGWVPVSETAKNITLDDLNSDISPPRKRRARNDTPSPESDLDASRNLQHPDMSPPRRRRARNDTPSPIPNADDMSPPRRRRARNDTPSPKPNADDMSPPRRRRARNDTPSPEPNADDMSPPRKRRARFDTPEPNSDPDLSPPRKGRSRESVNDDLSQPRRGPHKSTNQNRRGPSVVEDLSPPRKPAKEPERPKTGLVTGKDIKEEIARTKNEDWLRFRNMDPSLSGRGAEAVRRDKRTGARLSKEEIQALQKKDEKPKEVKLEWGKGLAQKREAEERLQELELEKAKPFARTRDDPDLDNMLKDRVRWGDPMAHLVKKKHSELVLPDIGDNEKMKESGFIVPQEVPKHSWLKRGFDAAPNRYGIKPGRHWDGVDRSNGFEKQMFNRQNEKQATEREAYLWSVSDM